MTFNIKNARWADEHSIDVDLEHPIYGWIPFTAHEDDDETHGREIFALAKSLAGPFVPREVPMVDPLEVPLERLDFWLAAAAAGVSKWSVRDRIAAMPEGPEKNAAIAYFEDAERYRRYDPLLIQMALAEGIDAERLDQLWREAVEAQA